MGMHQTQIEAAVAVSLGLPVPGTYEVADTLARFLFQGLMKALKLDCARPHWPTDANALQVWVQTHAARKRFDSSGNETAMWLTDGEQSPVASFGTNGRMFAEVRQRAGEWVVELTPHWPKYNDDVMRVMIAFENERLTEVANRN